VCLVDPLFLYVCECLDILDILRGLNNGFEKKLVREKGVGMMFSNADGRLRKGGLTVLMEITRSGSWMSGGFVSYWARRLMRDILNERRNDRQGR
jgi:hypothetical protein